MKVETTPIRVSNTLLQRINAERPDFLSAAAFLQLLAKEALDGRSTLREQPGRAASISNTSLEVLEKEEDVDFSLQLAKAKQLRESAKSAAKYTANFEAFWKTYQSCPKNLIVNSQSKPKAFAEWKRLIADVDPNQLINAALKAVEGQVQADGADEWVPPLPDAFRWLRDGKYEVMLEDHAPTQPSRPSHWIN